MSQQRTQRNYNARVSLGDSLNSELKNQLENFKSKLNPLRPSLGSAETASEAGLCGKPVGSVTVKTSSQLKDGVETHGIKPSHIACPGCGLNIKI